METQSDHTHIDDTEAAEALDPAVADGTVATASEVIPDDGDWNPDLDYDEPEDDEFEEQDEPVREGADD